MEDFTKSRHCVDETGKPYATLNPCHTCRLRYGGLKWRLGQKAFYALPNDNANFDCPHGVPWVEDAPQGLGDVVEKALRFTGISGVMKAIAPQGCGGCAKRQVALNALTTPS